MRTYRMETPGGGSNYHPVEDAVNGDWAYVDEVAEVIGNLKTQLQIARESESRLLTAFKHHFKAYPNYGETFLGDRVCHSCGLDISSDVHTRERETFGIAGRIFDHRCDATGSS